MNWHGDKHGLSKHKGGHRFRRLAEGTVTARPAHLSPQSFPKRGAASQTPTSSEPYSTERLRPSRDSLQHSNHTALGRNSPEGFCTGHEPTQLLVRAAVISEIILGGSQYSKEPSSVLLPQMSTRASSCPAPVTKLLLRVSAECPPQQHTKVQPQSTSCCFSTLSSGKR